MRLLEYRAQIDVQDSLGNTPLHLACNNGHMETATLLLMVSERCYGVIHRWSEVLRGGLISVVDLNHLGLSKVAKVIEGCPHVQGCIDLVTFDYCSSW